MRIKSLRILCYWIVSPSNIHRGGLGLVYNLLPIRMMYSTNSNGPVSFAGYLLGCRHVHDHEARVVTTNVTGHGVGPVTGNASVRKLKATQAQNGFNLGSNEPRGLSSAARNLQHGRSE